MAVNKIEAPRKILLIRLSALGDVVMASGLITALKQRHPHARLVWLTEPAAEPLLRGHPLLDEVIVWPKATWKEHWKARRWGTLLREIKVFRRAMHKHRFELSVDAQGLLKSGLCAWMSGARHRIALMPREGSSIFAHEVVGPPPSSGYMSAEYRHLAQHLGAATTDFKLSIVPGAAARASADHALRQAEGHRPIAALCPFTTRPQKHWFEDRWAMLARGLHDAGLQPVLLGGRGDVAAAARVAAAFPDVLNLAGQLQLDETAAVIARSALVVGVDTGLTHLGTAMKVPTVALFGSTRPYLKTDSPLTEVLYGPLPCSPCRRHPTCGGRFDCMRQYSVGLVLEHALTQWRKGPIS